MENKNKELEDFSLLIKRHGDRAYNFAFRLTGKAQEAWDLVQEAFTNALQHFDRYDPNRPFEPWLNRILKNIYLDSVRRYDHKHVVSLDGPSMVEEVPWENILPGRDATPAEQLEEQETNELIQQALNSLPQQYRVAVALCDIEQYSYQQMSEMLGCPVGTIRSRIHQGRILMKNAFEKLQNGGRKLAGRK